VRIIVYDQYWPTLGGGEKLAGGIAQALTGAGHDVTLLAHEPLDIEILQERLALDLSGVTVTEVEATPDAISAASGDADVFINASFGSVARSTAPASLYVVYFPVLPQLERSALRRAVAARGRSLLRANGDGRAEPLSGLHAPDVLRRHSARWTTGEAVLAIKAHPGETVPVVVALGRYLDPGLGPRPVEALLDGDVIAATTVRPVTSRLDLRRVTHLRFTVQGRPDGEPVQVALRSPTHSPAERDASSDHRVLGVPVLAVEAGREPGRRLAARLPGLLEPTYGVGFLDSYSRVLSISEFVQRWVTRLWERDSGLLYPPVTMYDAGPKADSIVSVGRFFGRGSGHSKKQLEMVKAFRRLHDGGAVGWTLHLVGGCAPEHAGYLDEVRDAAAGLPVKLHVGATGEELRRLYAETSIYWHATGLHENENRHPDRFEHFGITTVEAMSAGAVPVVIGAGGQREVVRDGVDGYWFSDLDGLVARTRELIDDPDRRALMADSARQAAQRFSVDAFAGAVVEEVTALSSPSPG
jgi:glycosyltransferase involved in cell wall biosynthesis